MSWWKPRARSTVTTCDRPSATARLRRFAEAKTHVVLVPSRPRPDLLAYLAAVGVTVVYPGSDTWTHRPSEVTPMGSHHVLLNRGDVRVWTGSLRMGRVAPAGGSLAMITLSDTSEGCARWHTQGAGVWREDWSTSGL